MNAGAALLVVLGLASAFGFNAPGCDGSGDDSSGGSSGSGGSAGSAGAAATCDQWTALQTCFTAFCKADGAGTPFCTCFLRGYDLGAPPGCLCVPLDPASFCASGPTAFDCSSATSAVASQCVGVQ